MVYGSAEELGLKADDIPNHLPFPRPPSFPYNLLVDKSRWIAPGLYAGMGEKGPFQDGKYEPSFKFIMFLVKVQD